jgi:ribose/xylose/arabinose/galactoside ABC-type transport system permease subunit
MSGVKTAGSFLAKRAGPLAAIGAVGAGAYAGYQGYQAAGEKEQESLKAIDAKVASGEITEQQANTLRQESKEGATVERSGAAGKGTGMAVGGAAGALKCAAVCAAIGSAVPIVGTVIGGAIGASYVGFTFELPIVLHTLAAIAAAIICAGLYGGFVGLLKARTGAHEVIVTIMLNYVASYFLLWLLSTKAFLREGRMDPIAPEVLESSRLPRLAGQDYRLHAGIFIALLAAAAIWWLLNRSTLGFKFRAVGANAKASRTAGISVAKSTTFVMVIAGALAGIVLFFWGARDFSRG